MNGLTFVPYELDDATPCPLCGFAHNRFTGIERARQDFQRHPRIHESIPPRIIGWALECGCLLPAVEWEWEAAAGRPMRWRRNPDLDKPATQGVIIGDHGTQTNTFTN